jgi:uncharacterized protein (TIGR03546 family)
MTLLLKQLFALIKLLNSETGTAQIAAGIAVGFILGMTPMMSLQAFIVLLILFIFRVQIGAAFLAAFFFKFVAYIFDPLFDSIGFAVLNMDALHSFFTALYNMPIVPFTRFNNTVVMGAFIITVILSPVVYVVSLKMVAQYRVQVVNRFKGTRAWKAIQATSFYQWYYKYDQYFGG